MGIVSINDLGTAYLIVCKVANIIFAPDNTDLVGDDFAVITLNGRKRGKKIATDRGGVDVRLDTDDELAEKYELGPYDRAVMDSVYSMCIQGITEVTASMVVRTLYGDTSMDVTSDMESAVRGALDKLAKVSITIDCTAEYRHRELIGETETKIFSGHMVELQPLELEPANHKGTVSGYKILEIPVMYQYADPIHQVTKVSTAVLGKTTGHRCCSETMLIRHYLVRRVAGVKNKRNHLASNKIVYDRLDPKDGRRKGLLPELGIDLATYANARKKRSKIHRVVVAVLDDLVRLQFIKGYLVETTNHKEVRGVTIDL